MAAVTETRRHLGKTGARSFLSHAWRSMRSRWRPQHWPPVGLIRRVVLVAALVGCAAASAFSQSRPPTEYEIKALFLYEFGRFVEWPSSSRTAGDSFAICVLGEDPFGIVLDEAVKNKVVSGYSVVVRRMLGVTEAGPCRILFISPSEENRLLEILSALEGRSVLTVGEGNLFARRGGMISFTIEDNRVRFSINLAATEREGLRMSSQLLRVARVVR